MKSLLVFCILLLYSLGLLAQKKTPITFELSFGGVYTANQKQLSGIEHVNQQIGLFSSGYRSALEENNLPPDVGLGDLLNNIDGYYGHSGTLTNVSLRASVKSAGWDNYLKITTGYQSVGVRVEIGTMRPITGYSSRLQQAAITPPDFYFNLKAGVAIAVDGSPSMSLEESGVYDNIASYLLSLTNTTGNNYQDEYDDIKTGLSYKKPKNVSGTPLSVTPKLSAQFTWTPTVGLVDELDISIFARATLGFDLVQFIRENKQNQNFLLIEIGVSKTL